MPFDGSHSPALTPAQRVKYAMAELEAHLREIGEWEEPEGDEEDLIDLSDVAMLREHGTWGL